MSNFMTKRPPINSKIEVANELNQTIIKWKNPRGGGFRFAAAIFLLAWLGGWAFGEFFAINSLLTSGIHPFLVFWLIGWTVGGFFAMRSVYQLVRPSKPETLSFDAVTFNYKRGTTPIEENRRGNNWFNKKKNNEDPDTFFQDSKSKYTIPKNEIGAIKLERIGERQRLTIDHGAERIEIGKFLQEPEREWVFEILKQWKGIQ